MDYEYITDHAEPEPTPRYVFGLLSEAEWDVLILLAQGCSDQQIADKRSISARTVRSRNGAIYRKLGVRDRTNAAIYAWRNGIVDPNEAWEVVKTLQWARLPALTGGARAGVAQGSGAGER